MVGTVDAVLVQHVADDNMDHRYAVEYFFGCE